MAEENHFTDFNNTEKLIWHERGLQFGNWTDGPQMDGSRLFSTTIEASEVWKLGPPLMINFISVFVTCHVKVSKIFVIL